MSNLGYQQHSLFTTPSDNTSVYHSIHLNHLKESITNKQLRFASVLSYKDQFEGRLPYPNEVSIGEWIIFINNGNPVFGHYQAVSKVLVNEILLGNTTSKAYPLKYFFDEWSNYIFSHCWSLNSNPWIENQGSAVITIQSTIGNIKNAFCGDYCFHIGAVKYINYLNGSMPSLTNLLTGKEPTADLLYERHLHKRLKYKNEEEVRLIVSWESFVQKHPGVNQILPHNPYDKCTAPRKLYEKDYIEYKKVDFSKLIDEIIIPPNTTKEQLEDLHSILIEANINLSVIRTNT